VLLAVKGLGVAERTPQQAAVFMELRDAVVRELAEEQAVERRAAFARATRARHLVARCARGRG